MKKIHIKINLKNLSLTCEQNLNQNIKVAKQLNTNSSTFLCFRSKLVNNLSLTLQPYVH